MRLIDVRTYKTISVADARTVNYAILSHRWETEEVLHGDMVNLQDRIKQKGGWYKIAKCCERAKVDGCPYVWVDTCCIDKTSSAELQEAINSMFQWYKYARVCYAFLCDVILPDESKALRRLKYSLAADTFAAVVQGSEWFKRGWTLQELVAPRNLIFFDQLWTDIGSRSQYASALYNITKIPEKILHDGYFPKRRPCIAEIMSWASGRQTTRIEDRAYSLLGLFNVTMPMLYGEGETAFVRLQEEILRRSDDQSIFAWSLSGTNTTALAKSPDDFARGEHANLWQWHDLEDFPRRQPHTITNEGIELEVLLCPTEPRQYVAVLGAPIHLQEDMELLDAPRKYIAIRVRRLDYSGRYCRWALRQHFYDELGLGLCWHGDDSMEKAVRRRITIVNRISRAELKTLEAEGPPIFRLRSPFLKGDNVQQQSKQTYSFVKESAIVIEVTHILDSNNIDYSDVLYQPYAQMHVKGLTLMQNGRKFKLSHITLSFDVDFAPVCSFRFDEIRDDSPATGYKIDMPQDTTQVHEDSQVTGPRWREMVDIAGNKLLPPPSDRQLVITSSLEDRDSGKGSRLRIGPSNPRNFGLLIKWNRSSAQDPWDFCVSTDYSGPADSNYEQVVRDTIFLGNMFEAG